MRQHIVSGRVLEQVAREAYEICDIRGWSRDWVEVSGYLHSEAAEFIEAIRGKRGVPVEEAGDVIFVLLSCMHAHGISAYDVLDSLERKMQKLRREVV